MATEATFGRYAEIPLEQMTSEQRNGYDAIIRARGMYPGPSKIWLENPAAMKQTVPLGAFYLGETTLAKAEREIAVVLRVAKWGAAYVNGEHKWIAQASSGYSHAAIQVAKVERMIGLAPQRSSYVASCSRSQMVSRDSTSRNICHFRVEWNNLFSDGGLNDEGNLRNRSACVGVAGGS